MCGINAIFAYRDEAPPVNRRELRTVRDRMARRGPDGSGDWVSPDKRVGLGHRRLSIIDITSDGDQPMGLYGGKYRIVFNGEIYNYQAIRERMQAEGRLFRTTSDTEVLLHLYDKYGPEMVHHLRGMFAFALWDEEKQGLLLARDGFGVKPLYLSDNGRCLRVASQVKALMVGGGIDKSPNPAGHVGFFLFGYVPEPHTLYRGIRSLGAGTMLWRDKRGNSWEKRFWGVQAAYQTRPPVRRPLRKSLLDSVAHHLVSDVPVGLFLSAGLDSATLCGLAAEQSTDLKTVTLGFEEYAQTENDEAPLAELVADLYGTEHQTRRVAGSDFANHADALFEAMDQPSIDGVNVYFVAKAAAEVGLKVAISGLGGDELFRGYNTFRQLPKLVKPLSAVPFARHIGTIGRFATSPWIGQYASPKAAGLLELGTRSGDAYLLRRGLFMPWELARNLDSDFARQGLDELAPLTRLHHTTSGMTDWTGRVTALEMTWYMRNQLLRDADWAGMAHSLEIRVPFVDRPLFEAAVRHGFGKQDMAATPEPALPQAVRERPKTGFQVPVRDWLSGQSEAGNADDRGLRGWAREVYDRFTG
ncbi:asparagine synthase (glutamine-hydrolyzing) [Magnetospira sp. QH-2]|uniref:asparagine synthase (glutamine-hydrolyzing) n=1 Tax=Magnetospira sp. (strain QH-2) TaxID=1288970 RepID=UPI0003E81A38|nr:asparagine synthase (glutamine-hydrolyzing) [Magnetospira sp. QH-2]CCQ72029.1 Asparagine synthase [Magnetospira sp. QH-2]